MSLINNSQNFDRLLKEMVYIPHLKVNIVYRKVGHLKAVFFGVFISKFYLYTVVIDYLRPPTLLTDCLN
jgi:hypothetical protein